MGAAFFLVSGEDFETGTRAAIAGGITTVVDMPNNPQPTTTLNRVKEKIKLAEEKALCPVFFYLGADQDNTNEFKKSFPYVLGLKVYPELHHQEINLVQAEGKASSQIHQNSQNILTVGK